MPRSYPSEYRRHVLDLVESGKPIVEVAAALEVTAATIYVWWKQHLIDTGQFPGTSTVENAELAIAGKRIANLLLGVDKPLLGES